MSTQTGHTGALDVGVVFRLRQEAMLEPILSRVATYEVIRRDPLHKAGHHLLVRVVGTDVVREIYIWPWTEVDIVERVTPDDGNSRQP